MKWLKAYKIFESSNFSSEEIQDVIQIFQYFLDEQDLELTKKVSHQIGKELPPLRYAIDIEENEYDYFLKEDKLYIIVCLNRKVRPSFIVVNKIIELKNKLTQEMIPMLESRGFKTHIEVLDQKIDSWHYVETGLKIEIKSE